MNKINLKQLAAFAGSIVLSGTITYNAASSIFNVKPFHENKYSIYRINLIEHKKDGQSNEFIYSNSKNFDSKLLMNSILIKTPYYIDEDGFARRDIYKYDINKLSLDEIAFIMDNIENQKLLFSKDYIRDIIGTTENNYESIRNNKYFTLFNYEKAAAIPYDNDFEISYTEYMPNSKEVLYYSSKTNDTTVNINYSVFTLI